jgi:hypothetical protein
MAIVDNTLVYSDGQAITATAASTNIIDHLKPGTPYGWSSPLMRDLGNGADIPLSVLVTQTFNNLTSLTVAFQVSDDAAFTTPVTVGQSGAIPLASLTAGSRITFPSEIPEGTTKQYSRLYYTVAGTAPTAGKIFAGVTAGKQTA